MSKLAIALALMFGLFSQAAAMPCRPGNCGQDGDPGVAYGQAYVTTIATQYSVPVNQIDVSCSGGGYGGSGEAFCRFSFLFGDGQSVNVGCDFIPSHWDANGDPDDYNVVCVENPRG